ncbi:hypothetical protein [Amycolatopsis sp. NBC_00438]|uniref:hypothetical protein n=1 Tax=Amycolatopsis sp. NBC_00438 TaxID=2903558 RepID=UPI002E2310B0
MSEEKRKPGRPPTGETPVRSVKMPDERWNSLGDKAKDVGSDRSKVINELAAWWTREDGAELPERP